MNFKRKLLKFTFQLLVFLIPTQLAVHFWPEWAHIFGIRVDYLAPSLYLTDIFVFLIFVGSLFRKNFFSRRFLHLFAGLCVFAFINILGATSIYPALFKWIKVGEMLFLGYFVKSLKKADLNKLLNPIAYSLILFSFIGIAQFLTGKTLGGPFYFLGERSFGVLTPGISTVSLNGQDFLRAYSTFGHPNAFAGYLLVSGILLLGFLKKHNKKLIFLSLLLGAIAFLFSFSFGAGIALALSLMLFYLSKKNRLLFNNAVVVISFFSVILSIISPIALQRFKQIPAFGQEGNLRRIALIDAASAVIAGKPVLGVGLNNFLYHGVSGWLQPVHNIFLLVFAESGIAGLALFSLLIFKALKNSTKFLSPAVALCIFAILTTGLFDHYWITLQSNELLFSFIIGLSLRKDNS